MFVEISYLKQKTRGLALRIFNAIENNGNCNFKSNGEKVFIDNLFYSFKNGKEKVIFDIGANIGEYGQMIFDKSLELNISIDLHLFEPTQSCFSIISDKFSESRYITLNNFGVSNENGKATIFYDKVKSGLASLYQRNLDSYNIQMNQCEEVHLRRMDSYIEEKQVEHIDFIKIDIEGHELKALEGFGRYLNDDFIDFIQFEYGGTNLDSKTSLMEMYKFLEDRGFVIAKMMTNGLEIRKYKPYMDNFQYANYMAISSKVL